MMPKALVHVQDGEDLDPMQSSGDFFNCWKGVVLTLNGMIEVLRAQTYFQGAVLKCLSKWHWESSRGVLDQG